MTETTNVSDKHEELFSRIALDNKLVTKFQLKKAADEQEKRAKEDGKRPPLGDVLRSLGFLTERQLQSIENAQRYREQRDFDKRFGRQILRMQLLDQAKVEEALEDQKNAYSKAGTVKTLGQVLTEKKLITAAQAEEVKNQIELRDKKKSAGGSALKPALPRKPEEDEDSMKLRDIEEDPAPAPAPPPAKDEDEDEEGEEDEEDEDEEGEEDEEDEDEEGEEDEEDEDEEDEDEEDEDEEDEDEEDEDEEDEDEEGEEDEEDEDEDGEDEEDEDEEVDEVVGELPDDVELDEKDLEDIEQLESGDEEEEGDKGWAADAFDDRPLAKRADGSSDQNKPLTAGKPAASAPTPAPAPAPGPKPATPQAAPRPQVPQKLSERAPAAAAAAPKPPAPPVAPAKIAKGEPVAIPGGELLSSDSKVDSRVEAIPQVRVASSLDIPGGSVFKDVPSQSGVISGSRSDSSVEEAPAKPSRSELDGTKERLKSSAEALEELLDKAEDPAARAPKPSGPTSRPQFKMPPKPAAPAPVADDGPITRRSAGTATSNPLGASITTGATADHATRTAGIDKPDVANDEFAALDTPNALVMDEKPAAAKPQPDLGALRRAFDKAFDSAREEIWKRFLEELGG